MCENRNGANDLLIQPLRAGTTDQGQLSRLFICTTWCKVVQIRGCGARVAAGVLDHQTFEWVRVDPGRCEICGKGGSTYRAETGRAVAPAKSDSGLGETLASNTPFR